MCVGGCKYKFFSPRDSTVLVVFTMLSVVGMAHMCSVLVLGGGSAG